MTTPMTKARERLKLSQSELARRCKVQPSTINRAETGDIWPSRELAAAIARELRMPVARVLYPHDPSVK